MYSIDLFSTLFDLLRLSFHGASRFICNPSNTKAMKQRLLLLGSLLVAITSLNAQEWKLIYENDGEGQTIHGKKERLVSMIQAGKPIRIYFMMGNGDTYVEHTTDVVFSTIMMSVNDTLVSAQIAPITGQTPDFVNINVTMKENMEWSLIASTSGRNDQMFRNVITGEIINHSVRKWGTKWFVKD